MKNKDTTKPHYTCNEYREEMILLGLQRRIANQNITQTEKQELLKEIETLKRKMKLD